jgi:hypothetical protein
MKTALAIFLLLAASPVFASDFCLKAPFDAEFPAGLEGRYEIVGKDPATGEVYSGRLVISMERAAYGLDRAIDGKVSKGQAWIEGCGPDKVSFLVVDYATKPVTRARCRLGNDGDNYYRATCRTDAGENSWRGIEAWFQDQDPAPAP